jgi:hypothetical protein
MVASSGFVLRDEPGEASSEIIQVLGTIRGLMESTSVVISQIACLPSRIIQLFSGKFDVENASHRPDASEYESRSQDQQASNPCKDLPATQKHRELTC